MPGRGFLRESKQRRAQILAQGGVTPRGKRGWPKGLKRGPRKTEQKKVDEYIAEAAAEHASIVEGLELFDQEYSRNGFALPRSPHDRLYAEIWDDIKASPTKAVEIRKRRQFFENDFWAACRWCSSLGGYMIDNREHPDFGTPWIEQWLCFDLCREYQRVRDQRLDLTCTPWWNLPRGHIKTGILTQFGSCWDIARDPNICVIIVTAKVAVTGHSMFEGIRNEIRTNPILVETWDEIFSNPRSSTKTEIRLRCQPPGRREPSLSIASLGAVPTSFHVELKKMDDIEVESTVESELSIVNTEEAFMAFAGTESLSSSATHAIGTVWHHQGAWKRLEKRGAIKRWVWRRRIPGAETSPPYDCYVNGDETKPIMMTTAQIAKLKTAFGEYGFACQMRGVPIAKGDQRFDARDLRYYNNDPHREAEDKNVYVVVDVASGKQTGDNCAIWVVALGSDRCVYALDLIREKWDITKAAEALIDVVRRWKPKNTYYEPPPNADSYGAYFALHQEVRRFRFEISPLPESKIKKEDRIRSIRRPLEEHRIWLPNSGFGHGSLSDDRDTKDQFVEDEVSQWSPLKGSCLYDDCLDGLAWVFFSGSDYLFEYPEDAVAKVSNSYDDDEGYGFAPSPMGW